MSDVGFSIFENVLSSQECAQLAKAFEDIASLRRHAGARNLMSNPGISAFAYDSRLLQLASRTLGEAFFRLRFGVFEELVLLN